MTSSVYVFVALWLLQVGFLPLYSSFSNARAWAANLISISFGLLCLPGVSAVRHFLLHLLGLFNGCDLGRVSHVNLHLQTLNCIWLSLEVAVFSKVPFLPPS